MSVPNELYGFVLKDTRDYKDCGYTGYLYQNEKFNCPFLYIRSEDTNNFFSVHFRTPQEDNTGMSHMLEHLSLRGSEKFPVRNIFLELKKRSYSTFMNAYTSSGYTAFPFGSTNQVDFFNDLEVYLDCVFHPQLTEVNFLSECHHLYFENGDPNKPLLHGGVIYNEMVGKYYKQSNIFNHKLNEAFFPDSPYRFSSGGIPDAIPNATFENIINHHSKYYHPVNSFFYFYGNDSFPVDRVFQKVSEVIEKFNTIESPYRPELYKMKPWEETRTVTIDAPADEKTPIEEQTRLTICFLIDEKLTNFKLVSDLKFLVEIIGKTNNSPLYQSLVIPGHVKSIHAELKQLFYPIIKITATGFLREKTDEIENMIIEIIKNYSNESSENNDLERLESHYHWLKLKNKKVPSNLGLVLFKSCAKQWTHGANPLDILDFDEKIDSSFKRVKEENYLQKLAKQFLVDNKHCLFARLNPVVGYNEKLIEEEKKRLQKVKDEMSQGQVQQILDNMRRISEEENKKQPLFLLPQIRRSDIERVKDFKEIDEVINDQISILINPTNGIVYANIVVSIDECKVPDLWLIHAMNTISNSVGAGPFNEYELSKYAERWVSNLHSHVSLTDTLSGKKVVLKISCDSLYEDIDKMQQLMKIISTEIHWNNIEKVEILVKRMRTSLGKNVVNNIVGYNEIRAAATINEDTAFIEAVNGLIGYDKFCEFIKNKSFNEIAEKCENLYNTILTNGKISGYISCGEQMKEKAISMLDDVIKSIQKVPKIEYTPINYSDEIFDKIKNSKTFLNAPIPTGTVSLRKLCPKHDQVKISSCLSILTKIMKNEALYEKVRGRNGAYSCNASYSPFTGIFTIISQRDTVPVKNYDVILDAIKTIDEFITDESVERAVVSFLSKNDTPKAPAVRGLASAMVGTTRDYLQERRDVYLTATAEDVRAAAKFLTDGEFNVSIATNTKVSDPPDGFEVVQI